MQGYTAKVGSDRCTSCIEKDKVCEVDSQAIARWRAGVLAGKKYSKAPRGIKCWACRDSRSRYKCTLPETSDLRKRVLEGDEEGPAAKKPRVEEDLGGVGDGSFLEPLLHLLTKLGKQVQKGVEEDRRSAAALERIATLLESRWRESDTADEDEVAGDEGAVATEKEGGTGGAQDEEVRETAGDAMEQ